MWCSTLKAVKVSASKRHITSTQIPLTEASHMAGELMCPHGEADPIL